MVPSSSGSGRRPLKAEVAGSNPVGTTKNLKNPRRSGVLFLTLETHTHAVPMNGLVFRRTRAARYTFGRPFCMLSQPPAIAGGKAKQTRYPSHIIARSLRARTRSRDLRDRMLERSFHQPYRTRYKMQGSCGRRRVSCPQPSGLRTSRTALSEPADISIPFSTVQSRTASLR